MKAVHHKNEVTERITKLELSAESFGDERLLSVISKIFYYGGKITAIPKVIKEGVQTEFGPAKTITENQET